MLSVFFKDSLPFYAFYLITIFWILEFIYFPSKNKSSKKIEKKTFFRILFSILFTIFMNIIMLLSFDFFYNPLYLQIISLILYFFGLCLRLSSLFFLGSNFSRNLSINENQKLVSNGPFKYLRHPSYLGLYLLTICVPLFFGNLILSQWFIGIRIIDNSNCCRTNMENRLGKKMLIPVLHKNCYSAGNMI